MDLMDRYPSLNDLHAPARRRCPRLSWEYLDSGTGPEEALARTRAAFEAVTMTPLFLGEAGPPDLSRTVLGQDFSAPFGIAPIGLQSLIWPGAERMLARAAAEAGVPYALSCVAAETVEDIAEVSGRKAWFQLYAPNDRGMRRDMIDRAAKAGIGTLLVTVDVPAPSRRERQRRAGVGMPPRVTARMLADFLMHPAWLRATLKRGKPRFVNIEPYASPEELAQIALFVGAKLSQRITPDILAEIRAQWPGKLVVKGLMHPDEARLAVEAGADGVVVSNHGGRQLDTVRASLDALPGIAEAVDGRAAVLFDSGVRSGMDVARALALGADMALLGRPFMWACAALGEAGGPHLIRLLKDELANVMVQLGCDRLSDLPSRLDR